MDATLDFKAAAAYFVANVEIEMDDSFLLLSLSLTLRLHLNLNLNLEDYLSRSLNNDSETDNNLTSQNLQRKPTTHHHRNPAIYQHQHQHQHQQGKLTLLEPMIIRTQKHNKKRTGDNDSAIFSEEMSAGLGHGNHDLIANSRYQPIGFGISNR
ncbi:hypothetical protein EYC80_010822 [Monilinia laxa]|uniref:Uncharacterized protein n=1 Tax=Monilinia laxa TaxID=61186 RepID=A0A5N6JS49_MONLA|nr:hypothetical protein EYC80_010822 [Monilinia laxa]